MFRTWRLLKLVVAAGQLAMAAHCTAEDAPRPNLVFMMADDLGWADVAMHGGPVPTPHLDRLAAEGLELSQHYVAPVCSPTRTGLLTGRYWSRFGVTSPQNERALPFGQLTLPRALAEQGYATCLSGKWHLGSRPEWGPNHFGFDHSYGSLAGGVGPWNHFYKQGPFSRTWHRNETLLEEAGHVTDLITQEAVRWLCEPRQQPFFLYVPFTAVHLPVREPAAWLDKVPPTIKGDVPRHYAACIMHLDHAVGQIVAAVSEEGLRPETLIVFTSDNGGSTAQNNDTKYPGDDYPTGRLPGSNRPWRGEKGSLYEGGIRVPTLVSWPAKIRAGIWEQPTHIVDWMPTFCALAGGSRSDPAWDGQNLWPGLSGKREPWERSLYWVSPGWRSRAVRRGNWKLIEFQDRQRPVELYHLTDDPSESHNLAEQQPEQRQRLQQELAHLAARDREVQP